MNTYQHATWVAKHLHIFGAAGGVAANRQGVYYADVKAGRCEWAAEMCVLGGGEKRKRKLELFIINTIIGSRHASRTLFTFNYLGVEQMEKTRSANGATAPIRVGIRGKTVKFGECANGGDTAAAVSRQSERNGV